MVLEVSFLDSVEFPSVGLSSVLSLERVVPYYTEKFLIASLFLQPLISKASLQQAWAVVVV